MACQEQVAMSYNIMQNNNVAQRNVDIVGVAEGDINGVICVGNLYDWIHAFCLKFNCESNSLTLWQEAELTVKLSTSLYAAWERGGFQGENIQLIGDKLIRIKAATAKLCNLIFEPKEVGFPYIFLEKFIRLCVIQKFYIPLQSKIIREIHERKRCVC